MKSVVEISIGIPNHPGALARMSDMLRAADVNIEALFCREGDDESVFHMILSDPETAKIVLRQIAPVKEETVVSYTVKNKPGTIADLARKCAGAGINIRHIYATSMGKEAMCYLSVDDIEKAKKVLK